MREVMSRNWDGSGFEFRVSSLSSPRWRERPRYQLTQARQSDSLKVVSYLNQNRGVPPAEQLVGTPLPVRR